MYRHWVGSMKHRGMEITVFLFHLNSATVTWVIGYIDTIHIAAVLLRQKWQTTVGVHCLIIFSEVQGRLHVGPFVGSTYVSDVTCDD